MEITLPYQVTSQQHSGYSGFDTGTKTQVSRATWMHLSVKMILNTLSTYTELAGVHSPSFFGISSLKEDVILSF